MDTSPTSPYSRKFCFEPICQLPQIDLSSSVFSMTAMTDINTLKEGYDPAMAFEVALVYSWKEPACAPHDAPPEVHAPPLQSRVELLRERSVPLAHRRNLLLATPQLEASRAKSRRQGQPYSSHRSRNRRPDATSWSIALVNRDITL